MLQGACQRRQVLYDVRNTCGNVAATLSLISRSQVGSQRVLGVATRFWADHAEPDIGPGAAQLTSSGHYRDAAGRLVESYLTRRETTAVTHIGKSGFEAITRLGATVQRTPDQSIHRYHESRHDDGG